MSDSSIVADLLECAADSRAVEGDYYADQFSTSPEIFERAVAEIKRLMASRDEWIVRSNSHAMEADTLRVECINLKGRLWEMQRDMKAKDIVLECARHSLKEADKINLELTQKLEAKCKT